MMDFPSVTQMKKKVFTLKNPLKIKNRYFKSDFVFTQLVYAPDLFCPGEGPPNKNDRGARCTFHGFMGFRVFSLKMSTVGASGVPFRLLRQTNMT